MKWWYLYIMKVFQKNNFFPFILSPIVFDSLWIIYYSKYFSTDLIYDYTLLNTINSDSMGYSGYILVGTIVAAIFLLNLYYSFPNFSELLIIKIGRKKYLKKCFTKTLVIAFYCTLTYKISNMIGTQFLFNYEILKSINFTLLSFFHFILVFSYLFFIGLLFCMVFSKRNSKTLAIIVSLLISFTLVGIKRVMDSPFDPINDICIIDDWFTGEFNLLLFIIVLTKTVVLSVLIYSLSLNIFSSGDIISNSSKTFGGGF